MGQDFLRRRNDRFVRQRERRTAEQMERDLMNAIPPEMVVSLCGTAIGHVSVSQELWAAEVNSHGPIDFYNGDSPAVRIEGAPAEHLRRKCNDPQASVVARVIDVEGDHQLVTLKIGAAHERR